jgi:hypothetical protein
MKILLLIVLLADLCACRLISELMHMAPPRVIAYAPSSTRPPPASLEAVYIEFSQIMNQTKSEEAFGLLEDGTELAGSFAWEGRLLRYEPFAGFRENRTYMMRVAETAEDRYGNSLAEEFSFRFFTGQERIPPRVSGHSPAEGEVIADLRRPLRLMFSESVDRGSLYRAFDISPRVSGSWSWNSDASEAVYLPLENYDPGTEYRVEVDTSLLDLSGNQLAETTHFRFSIQQAPEQELLSLSTCDHRLQLQPADLLPLNQGIEKDDCFSVQLSAPAAPDETAGFITVVPALPCWLTWTDDFKGCSLHFGEYLRWEGVYELRLLELTYRLQVTGAASRPPEVVRVTFCNDTSAALFCELGLNQNLSLTDSSSACFDFYIEHAAGFPVDLGSFLEALRVEGGECLTITQLTVARNPLPSEHVPPDPAPGIDVDVLRLYCRLENTANPPGVISLGLSDTLEDGNQNHLQQPFLLMVNKL